MQFSEFVELLGDAARRGMTSRQDLSLTPCPPVLEGVAWWPVRGKDVGTDGHSRAPARGFRILKCIFLLLCF